MNPYSYIKRDTIKEGLSKPMDKVLPSADPIVRGLQDAVASNSDPYKQKNPI